MNNLLPNKKELTPITKEWSTFYESGFNDDFDKLDLVVGEIVEAKKHPKADKLLVFKVNIGSEVRQIVSQVLGEALIRYLAEHPQDAKIVHRISQNHMLFQ